MTFFIPQPVQNKNNMNVFNYTVIRDTVVSGNELTCESAINKHDIT